MPAGHGEIQSVNPANLSDRIGVFRWSLPAADAAVARARKTFGA